MANLTEILNTLDPVSLKEINAVELLDRKDTKFFFAAQLLPQILDKLTPYYRILEVNQNRQIGYQ
ncbi:MAG: hypothetical protein ACK4IY_09395, partial [Chitinophagales bacterium]